MSLTAPSPSLATIPRWVTAAAFAIPLLVLPSAAWRTAYIVDVWIAGPGPCDTRSLGEGLYILSLSVVSLGFALLTTGLVRPWGDRVPLRVAVGVGAAGASLIGLLTAYFLLNQAFGFVEGPVKPVPAGCSTPDGDVLALYAPLIAWAPLLAAVTWQHWLRRTWPERHHAVS